MERKAVNSHHEINWSTSDKANCESFISGKGLPRSNQIARFEYDHPCELPVTDANQNCSYV